MVRMKKAIFAIFELIILTIPVGLAGAIPVLDSITAWQSFSLPGQSDIASETPIVPQLEGSSIQLIDGQLMVFHTYTANDSDIEIEVQTQHPIQYNAHQGTFNIFGNARVKIKTIGHDTEGLNIYHYIKVYDQQPYTVLSYLQPSPSSWTFSEVFHGNPGDQICILIEGWIKNTLEQVSEHKQTQVYITF
jgi:hypothetical protein